MLNVLFFARLKDQLGTSSIEVDVTFPLTVAQLKQLLIEQHDNWQTPLSSQNLLCAVNHNIVNEQHLINASDEVAFFPPVTGG